MHNVDGTQNIAGRIEKSAEIEFEVCRQRRRALFYITTLGKQAIRFGLPWLMEENPLIDWRCQTLQWRTSKVYNIYALIQEYHEPTNDLIISYIQGEATEEARDVWNDTRMNKAMLFAYEQDKEKLKEMATKSLKELVSKELHEYLSVFSDEEASRMPQHTDYDHKIELKKNFIPKKSKVYRIDPVNEDAFNKFIDENLAKGYIRKSEQDLPQAAGFFFISKKDGKVQPVQDYRYLNENTVKNAYPLPRFNKLIDRLAGKKLFTKMDI